jgi:rhamnosyltransferase subunit B
MSSVEQSDGIQSCMIRLQGVRTPRKARRVLLVTFGSVGDLNPFIALALELKARGHHPIVATSPSHKDRVSVLELEFRPVRPDQPNAETELEVMQRLVDSRRGSEYLVREVVMPALWQSYADTVTAIAGIEFLVSHPMTLVVPSVAEKFGVPWASSMLAPMCFFSAYDPPVPADFPDVPAVLKSRPVDPRISRPILSAARLQHREWAHELHQLRELLRLPRLEDPLWGAHSPDLVLALFSSILGPKQPDWPRQTVVTGFPFLDHLPPAALDFELERFLSGGEPPIVFRCDYTLGDGGEFCRESAIAANRIGRRAVLLVGSRRRNSLSLPSGTFVVEHVPFSSLFTRCAVVVHQGGIGTLGEAMRAGKPMLIVPFTNDQPDNAARAQRLGIARILSRKRYRADNVERELRMLLAYEQYSVRAIKVAEAMRAEQGVKTACDALEQWFESTRPSTSN